MIHENTQNRYPEVGPEETRPLAALRNDDRHSPLASDTPTARLKTPSTRFESPPMPPSIHRCNDRKGDHQRQTFEAKHYDDEMNELRSTNREQ